MEWQMYFSAENLPEVRWDIIKIGQQGIVLCGICGGRKTEKHGMDMQGYVQG